ncbi:MAG: SulP family inorganic anion transporter [Magnetococcales bacterium]|nr:SulP family inorganic anion transporter [Magnetococcales bacterium]
MPGERLLRGLCSAIPIIATLRDYRAGWLRGDVVAGITACIVMIPSVIAYAELVHMPPITGVYAALAACVGYALFASSRHVIAGPDAAIGLLAGSAILPLADGDPSRIPALAASLCLLSGVMLVLAGKLRVGTIADFLSRPVLVGYLNGASLILVSTQLGKLFAIQTTGEDFFPLIFQVAQQLPKTHAPTLMFGVSSILFMVVLGRWLPKLPGALAVSLLGIGGSLFLGFDHLGIALVGSVPVGTPQIALPVFHWSDIPALAPAAAAIAFLAFSDGILLAQVFADKNRYEINPNRELAALGAANIFAGMLQGFPVSASQSRTSIVDASGGKTQVAQLVAALGLLLFLYFMTDLLVWLPKVTLGAILIVTAVGMLEIKAVRELYRIDRFECVMSLMVTAAILVLGVVPGIILGLLISLIIVIMEISRPGDAVLKRTSPGKKFHDFGRQEVATAEVTGLLVYRLYAPLIFANARHVMNRLRELVHDAPHPVSWIVIDAQAITDMDVTAAQRFAQWHREMVERGIDIKIADAPRPFMDQLEKVGLSEAMGTQQFYGSVKRAVEDFEARQNPVREVALLVQEDDHQPYEMLFRREGSNLTALCSCEDSGKNGLCSHRVNILRGDCSGLHILQGSHEDLQEIAAMVEGSDVEEALQNWMAADMALQLANKDFYQAKEELTKAMQD